jgi:NTE family protein
MVLRLSSLFNMVFALLLAAGCSSYGVVKNVPKDNTTIAPGSYSYAEMSEFKVRDSDTSLILAFSGGGTRAAALSYGVLLELRDTNINLNGNTKRMLDEIDVISSVSGGSFTAAYYGLHGDDAFNDFEQVFLRRNIEGHLIRSLFNPFNWFKRSGRTETAIKYYEKEIFHGATFADMQREDGPLIVINASDLAYGVRFSFIQEYFNLLCSDLSSYPVARAVTASSAVPVVFNPVVVQNYPDCKSHGEPQWLIDVTERSKDDPQLQMITQGLDSYFIKENREYVHFVDGGITDNLGLRSIYEAVAVSGGAKAYMDRHKRKIPRQMAIISVNASTDPDPDMDGSNKEPSIAETIGAVTDVQLHRYNVATHEVMKNAMQQWTADLSTPDLEVTPYYIQIEFRNVKPESLIPFFNAIPTSFSLTDEQNDKLIKAGRDLLRNNPVYQQLVRDLGGTVVTEP